MDLQKFQQRGLRVVLAKLELDEIAGPLAVQVYPEVRHILSLSSQPFCVVNRLLNGHAKFGA